MHCEVAIAYECSTCGARGAWTDAWSWFGSEEDIEEGRPVPKFCSKNCQPVDCDRGQRQSGVAYNIWVGLKFMEPNKAARHDRWSVLNEVSDPAAHRKVPMPAWPGPGKCRWCLEPTIYESGKKKGQPAARNWHNDCYYQYQLHTEIKTQFNFLFERDGPRCQICGEGSFALDHESVVRREGESTDKWWRRYQDPNAEGRFAYLKPSIVLEVDHIIPLWRAVTFWGDLAFRRSWYGPPNLWLLCVECHKAKTAIEAAERAADRRSP